MQFSYFHRNGLSGLQKSLSAMCNFFTLTFPGWDFRVSNIIFPPTLYYGTCHRFIEAVDVGKVDMVLTAHNLPSRSHLS